MWQSASTLQAAPAAVAAKPAIALPESATQSVNAIAAILTAQPVAVEPAPTAEPVQATASTGTGKGTIQGVITRAGTSEPIPEHTLRS
jgi:hypothetical protein